MLLVDDNLHHIWTIDRNAWGFFVDEHCDVPWVHDFHSWDAGGDGKGDIIAFVDDDGLKLGLHFKSKTFAVLNEDSMLHFDFTSFDLNGFILEIAVV